MNLNAALFYTDFQDQQLLITPTGAISPVLTNAGAAEIFGLEVEGQALISKNFSIAYAATFLDSEYTEFSDGPRDLSGQPLSSAPDYNVSISPQFTFPFRGGESFVTLDLNFVGEQRAGTDYDLLERDVMDAYTRVGAQMGWRGETIDAFIWGRNLTDETILRDWLDLSTFGIHQYVYDEPISWGVTVSKRF